MSDLPTSEQVLSFWFGDWTDDTPLVTPDANMKRWWSKSDETDRHIAETYGALHAAAHRGDLDKWDAEPRSALALVLVLDQFSRVIHRGAAGAFACDAKARGIVNKALTLRHDAKLSFMERVFLYMPLMHSESIKDHERATTLFAKLYEAAKSAGIARAESYAGNLDFETKHRKIIERFGRYPHRNDILGRESTDEEVAFLKEPGSSF